MVMFRNCAALFVGISLILTSAPALAGAKITYSAYEGPASIKTGEGGTKITKNGIDYWTSGTPPRQYEVIGMVQDRRDEAWDGGNAIGSPSIAKKVRAAGGDAVIMQAQNETGSSGGYGSATGTFGFMAMGGSKTITTMLVVKYLQSATTLVPADAPDVNAK
jgi:hypothetical protein